MDSLPVISYTLRQGLLFAHALPPGFHAHLGYLYGEMGRNDLMQQQFVLEKELYPESATYIDFLIQNA